MIFRQLFDAESFTYTYLLAGREGGEALLIDPVRERAPVYVQLMEELGVRLVFAIDTHVHADHITALGQLREQTNCVTIMGRESKAACVSRTVQDGDILDVDGLKLRALYTPGHTDDSYSFVMDDRVFTGDTLLIRGTGRTDFQNGDPAAQYDSIFGKLLALGDALYVYPAHDYRGFTVSTIGEERRHNPRLRVSSKNAYIEQMRALHLPNPKLMDIAVPANLACGKV
jgi:sulfur dioxygenase